MKPNMKKWAPRALLFVSVLLVGLAFLFNNAQEDEGMDFEEAAIVPYSQFLEMAEDNSVEAVHVNFSADQFHFVDFDGEKYETENPRYSEFKKDLLEKNIEVVTVAASRNYLSLLFPILQMTLIIFLVFFIIKRMSPSFGDKKSALLLERPSIRFKDIAGLDESQQDIEHLVGFLKNPGLYAEAGAKLPKGIVLYGPPGTGKTLTAKAVAGEANVPFLSVSGSDFVEMYVGLGARRVRKLFEEARTKAPCIIFIDEIDAVGGKRTTGPGSGEGNQTINALLAEMDGFSTKEGIIVMAATNRIEDLDPALVRPGRFDRHVAINLPDIEGRRAILRIHTRNKRLADDVNLEDWAKMTIGFSGAALEMLMNEAAIQAVNAGSSIVRNEDIDEAYYKTVMKGSKKNRGADADMKEVKIIAYHEAGHALAAKLLTENDVPRVTIIPSTSGAGGVTFSVPKKMGLLTREEFLANIKVLYAGRASEEILAGGTHGITTGASSDIDRSTDYIVAYFEHFGFSEEFGMLKLGKITGKGHYAKEAKKLSSELYQETKKLLHEQWPLIKRISEELMEKETLTGEDLDRILDKQ